MDSTLRTLNTVEDSFDLVKLINEIESASLNDVNSRNFAFWEKQIRLYSAKRTQLEFLQRIITDTSHAYAPCYQVLEENKELMNRTQGSDEERDLIFRVINNILFLRTNGKLDLLSVKGSTDEIVKEILEAVSQISENPKLKLKKIIQIILEDKFADQSAREG